jgi:general secretion pathway protein B
MSFILDALRKSENERQREIGPSFADVKAAAPARRLPILWLAIGLLLVINVVALGVIFARRGESTRAPAPAAAVPTAPTPMARSPTDQLPAAGTAIASPLPAAAAPPAPVVDEAATDLAAPEPLLDRPQLDNYAADQNVPTMNEVITQGRAQLPELHLDMHVYATAPPQRFVSINGHKLREGMQIEEGLHVERITRDGVVLNYRGLRFQLPRQ